MTKSKNDIKIQTIRWEFDTVSMGTAHRWQEIASKFSQQELAPIMETLIAPYNQSNRVIRLDKLELDLSQINSEEQLEERFRQIFSEKLSAWTIYRSEPDEKGTESELKADLLAKFRHYLLTGYFQWNVQISELDDPDFFEILEGLPADELNVWLQPVLASGHALVRFVELFTELQLRSLFLRVYKSEMLIADMHRIELILEKTQMRRNSYTLFYSLFKSLAVPIHTPQLSFLAKWWSELQEMGFVKEGEIRQASLLISESMLSGDVQFENFFSLLQQVDYQVLNRDNGRVELKEIADSGLPDIYFKVVEQSTFIDNAGIILLYPYLKKWFLNYRLLGEGEVFTDPRRQLEACYLLQYIATGDPLVREYDLVLNKTLCGFPQEAPVSRYWDPKQANRGKADECIRQVIELWPGIGAVTPQGFRASFLLRPGKLVEEDMNWLLIVERKAWDMLLDKLSYPISIIKLPWMNKPLYVQW